MESAVIVIGAGTLGVPACVRLASAGVRRIGVVDGAEAGSEGRPGAPVPRADGGARKADVAAAWVSMLAPHIQADPYPAWLDSANAAAMIHGHDLAVDLSNDAATRAASGEASRSLGIPHIAGGFGAACGWLAAARPPEPPCHECIEELVRARVAPASGAGDSADGQTGVAAAGVIGELAALAALRLLSGASSALLGRLQTIGADGAARLEPVPAAPDCSRCGMQREAVW